METLRPYMCLPETNILVLNSLSFLNSNRSLMERHQKVFACLDNDEAGNKATTLLNTWDQGKFWDARKFYSGQKDLNEWLFENLDKVMLQYTRRSLTRMEIKPHSITSRQKMAKEQGRRHTGKEL